MSNLHEVYLRRSFKVILPAPSGNPTSPELVASAQRNLQSLGFLFSKTLFEATLRLSTEQLVRVAEDITKHLKKLHGAHRQHRPMYPQFPRQVIQASHYELYMNAVMHYWTLDLPQVDVEARPLLQELVGLKYIHLGDAEDWFQICRRLLASKVPYSSVDRVDVAWLISQYGSKLPELLPVAQTCKENLAFISAELLKNAPGNIDWFARQINSVTDILRLLAALNGGDVSLATSTRIGKLPRSWRVLLLTWMEARENISEDMLRYPERWKRVGERLHPGEYRKRFTQTAQAFDAIRNRLPVDRFSRRVELALQRDDLDAAVENLAARPGELARRLDMLLCRGFNADKLLRIFDQKAEKVSNAVLLQVMTHFEHRFETAGPDFNPRYLRVFFPKGQIAKLFARPNHRPIIPSDVCQSIVRRCEGLLVQRFSKLAPLGSCYLDPDMKNYLAPFAQRSAAKTLRTLTRGSVLPLPNANTLRFFLWWKNGRNRTDIDLSAAMFDEKYTYVDTLAYYNLRSYGACHSGDIVDAPHGASEFIDIDKERMRMRNVRYVIMCINSYSGQAYADLPECFAGWMARQKPDSGEIFEPKTVVDKVDVASDTVFCLPAVFDLAENKVIWTDIALSTVPRYQNNVASNLSGVSLMLRAVTNLNKLNLHRLFGLHITARGRHVDIEDGADTIFSPDRGVTPFDQELIQAEYL